MLRISFPLDLFAAYIKKNKFVFTSQLNTDLITCITNCEVNAICIANTKKALFFHSLL